MAEPGDRVKVISDREYEGILMPNEETGAVVVKLDSGYNVGINKPKSIKVLSKAKAKKHAEKKVKPKKGLPMIAVLHTGGTIASKVDYESGGVSAKFSAADLIALVPELQEIANIETELVANMMSEDMGFAEHVKIARAAENWAKKGVKGIIIGHGTDTLGYTAAALSFMFERINIPILLVGSQRSSDRGSSDAAMNLLCAARFIAEADFCGIATCLHNTTSDGECAIIPGTKARKMHTSRRDAFRSVNSTPYALVSDKVKKLREYPQMEGIELRPKMSSNVVLVQSYPEMGSKFFDFCRGYDGIVIAGTGLGHAPTNLGADNLKSYEILKKYIAKGGIVAMTSQCIYGRVHPFVYTNLRRLSKIGVVYCEDMLPETAYIKLSWLLANYPKDKVADMMKENLRGEISERLGIGEYPA